MFEEFNGLREVKAHSMEKHHLLNYMKNVILIIFLGILVALTILSAFYTCSIKGNDWVKYRTDYPLVHIALFVVVSVIIGGMFSAARKQKRKRIKPGITKRIQPIVLLAFFLLLLSWVLVTQEKPRADMEICLAVAKQILNGDFSAFQPGMNIYLPPYQGYMVAYPFQLGFVLLCALISSVCGSANFLIIQIINAICVVLTVYYLYRITCVYQDSTASRLLTLLFTIVFLPLSLSLPIVYGNLIGLLLSIIAFYNQLFYLKERKLRFAFASIVCIAVAVLIKTNELILLTAMAVLYLLDSIEHRSLKSLILLVSIFAGYFASKALLVAVFEASTGIAVSKGVPMIAYVAMGLQNSGSAPGWYNNYTLDIFFQNGMNAAATAEESIRSIQLSMRGFSSDVPYMAQFFARKISSQWADPSFQCFWMYESNSALHTLSPFVQSCCNGSVAKWLHNGILNYFQTFIYLGACCYTVLCWKSIQIQELLFPICLIGGVLFSLIWEAQAQYTMPFFILLIPLAAKGIVALANRIADVIEKRENSKIERKANI